VHAGGSSLRDKAAVVQTQSSASAYSLYEAPL